MALALQADESASGAEHRAVRWLRGRLAWEQRLTELRREAGRVPVDEIAHLRGAGDTSPVPNVERLPAAS
jgi:hypothetical protein